ncbi:hypothetical protein [Lentzea sp. NPDC051838]|uniref:hypothetical protein n=1 Tax=Lentzea sp. NPDC051838 TaxID=3154849 RepID=UPI003425495F
MADDDQYGTHAAIAVVIGIVLLAISLPALPKAFKVSLDLGTPGTYVVSSQIECSARCYSRSGTFTSDDGKTTRSGVHIRNGLPRGLKEGTSVRAFDIGARDEVFTHEGQAGYPYGLFFILGIVGAAALVLGVDHAWRNRKRP